MGEPTEAHTPHPARCARRGAYCAGDAPHLRRLTGAGQPGAGQLAPRLQAARACTTRPMERADPADRGIFRHAAATDPIFFFRGGMIVPRGQRVLRNDCCLTMRARGRAFTLCSRDAMSHDGSARWSTRLTSYGACMRSSVKTPGACFWSPVGSNAVKFVSTSTGFAMANVEFVSNVPGLCRMSVRLMSSSG